MAQLIKTSLENYRISLHCFSAKNRTIKHPWPYLSIFLSPEDSHGNWHTIVEQSKFLKRLYHQLLKFLYHILRDMHIYKNAFFVTLSQPVTSVLFKSCLSFLWGSSSSLIIQQKRSEIMFDVNRFPDKLK